MKKLFFAIFSAAFILSGCNKSVDGPGKLSIKITDDPFNISYVESASVTITKVEIRKAGAEEGNPFLVLSEDSVTFDLSKLRNGITEELLNLEIPQGKYDLIRLYVDQASLKIKDQPFVYKVKVPGGKETGIKIFISPALNVGGGLTSELILDFDLSRSFVMRGNMDHSAGVNGFIFKPCIRATNNSTAGRIEGFVKDTSKVMIVNARVWIKQDTILATAFTDTLGHYAFIGIPAGTYSTFATKENYDTVGYSGINVIEGNRTIQDFILTRK
jgi:hypothetical protein